MDNVWSKLSHRTRERIGCPLPERPDASDPEFLQLLSALRRADSGLAAQVIDAFTGTDQRLPSEVEATAEQRRQRVRACLFGRFFRPDGLRSGRVRLNARKAVRWAVAALAVSLLIWSSVPKSSKGTRPSPPAEASAVSAAPAASSALAPFRVPASTHPLLWTPPAPPPPPPPEPTPLTVIPPNNPVLSTRQAVRPAAIWQETSPWDDPASKVIVYQAQTASRETSPVVYERTIGQPTGLLPPIETRSTDAGLTGTIAAAPPEPIPGTTADPTAFRRGQILEAVLVTPLTVPSGGGRTPVLAELTQGPLQGSVLVGQAATTSDGLVGIQFTMLISRNGQEHHFTGIAYDIAHGRPEIEGEVSTTMPGVASALTAATLQATVDYFRSRAQQQQVTWTNGFLTTTTQSAPTFWDSLAAAVAKAFTPAVSATAGPTVVTRLEGGKTIAVLVT